MLKKKLTQSFPQINLWVLWWQPAAITKLPTRKICTWKKKIIIFAFFFEENRDCILIVRGEVYLVATSDENFSGLKIDFYQIHCSAFNFVVENATPPTSMMRIWNRIFFTNSIFQKHNLVRLYHITCNHQPSEFIHLINEMSKI